MKNLLLLLTVVLVPLSLLAQEQRKYEIGVDASIGFKAANQFRANKISLDLFGGYKVNKAFSAGIGLNYSQYAGRTDLATNLENVFISTDIYRGFRPYVYARYVFLPNKRWTPYVGARVGYAFFMNSKVSYNVFPSDGYGFYYGEQDLSEYEYLKNLDHSLGIKGGVFGVLDLGAAVHIGKKGSKLSMGVSMDLQPVKFSYNNTVDRKFNFTVGPKIGFSF